MDNFRIISMIRKDTKASPVVEATITMEEQDWTIEMTKIIITMTVKNNLFLTLIKMTHYL